MFDVVGDRDLNDVISDGARAHGAEEFLAFQSGGGSLVRHTWEHFYEAVQQFRSRLASHGVCDQRVVVSLLPNSPGFLLTWFAVATNGAIHLPLDYRAGATQVAQVLQFAEPLLVVASPESAATARRAISDSGLVCDLVVLGSGDLHNLELTEVDGLRESIRGSLPRPESNMDVAGLIQTSGTTGVPKLVELTHANYLFAGEAMLRNFSMTANDRHFIAMPLYHSGAQVISTMPAVVSGGSIGMVQRFSASQYLDQARATESTQGVLVAPPLRMVLNALKDHDPVDAGSLQQIIYSQRLSDREHAEWGSRVPNVRLTHAYGASESVTLRFSAPPWEAPPQDSFGRPHIETTARIVDTDGRVMSDGPGELQLHGVPGRTLMRGYYRNEDVTSAVLQDGWLHTSDVVRRGEDGRFYFESRAGHVMRRGGENVSLPEVEFIAQDSPMVIEVAARSIPDPILEERLVLYVIPSDSFDRDEFIAWCVDHIGRTGKPDDVVVMEEFPRSAIGKIAVHALPLPEPDGVMPNV